MKLITDSNVSFDISEDEFQVIMNCLTELAYGFKEEVRKRNSIRYQELEGLLNRVTSYYLNGKNLLSNKPDSKEATQHSFTISSTEFDIIQVSFSEVKNLIKEKTLARIGFDLHFLEDLSQKFKIGVSIQN